MFFDLALLRDIEKIYIPARAGRCLLVPMLRSNGRLYACHHV
jgi:hypothetical protein